MKAGPKGDPDQWTTFPMQIGRYAADTGYDVVSGRSNSTDTEKTRLVITDELFEKVQNKNSVVGQLNVRVGIAYLCIVAIGEVGFLLDKILNPQILIDSVGSKETGLDAIANRLKTTTNNIIQNTSGITRQSILHAGDEIKYQKAELVRGILSWKDWKTEIKTYNSKPDSGKGDPDYLFTIERGYQIIISRNR